MKKISLVLLILWSSTIYGQITKLRFDKKGEFKILQLTDLHHDPTSKSSYKTFETIKNVVKKETPDFIVVTGDIITASPADKGWNELASILNKTKIPWTVTFGNHDEEHDMTKEDIYQILRKEPYFIGEKGNSSGVLNFAQPILSSQSNKISAVMYFFDSHDYVKNPSISDYDWIKQDQIQWYQATSNEFKRNNQNKIIPSISFFHIPLVEMKKIENDPKRIGERKDDGVGSSDVNSGLLSAMITQKDMMGVFAGHDHNNNYIGITKNIALGYGNVTGNDAYGTLERGGRIIILKENKFAFTSYITTPTKTDFVFNYPSGLPQIDKNTKILPAQKVKPTQKGIRYKYYQGTIEKVADIDNLKVIKKGILPNFNIKEAEQKDHYAFIFDGYFYASETAYYKFYVYSDDGAVLKIDDKIIIDNDGGHSPKRKENNVALEKGFHKINLRYFEDYMGQVLEVGFSSISTPEQVVNIKNLFYD